MAEVSNHKTHKIAESMLSMRKPSLDGENNGGSFERAWGFADLELWSLSELQRFNDGLVGRVLMENIAQCKQRMLLHICCGNSVE